MATIKTATAHITTVVSVMKKGIATEKNTITKITYSYLGGAQAKRTARNKAVASYWNMVALTETLAFIVVFGKQAKKEEEMKQSQERMAKYWNELKTARVSKMDQVIGTGNVTVAKDKMEDGMFTLVEGEGFVSANMWIERAMKVEEETVTVEETVKSKTYQFELGNENNAYQAYCYNMYCHSRDKAIMLQYLYAEKNKLQTRIAKGQDMMKNLYKAIVKKYGFMVVSVRPTVMKGSDIIMRNKDKTYNYTGDAKHMTINMVGCRLVYSHYQDGNVNNQTKSMFTRTFGFEQGSKLFAEYASDLKTFSKCLSTGFAILSDIKALNGAIAETMTMSNSPAIINAEFAITEDGHSVSICPHCGEPVRVFSSMTYHLGVDKRTVTEELNHQTYDLGNGRFVTLNSNGDIVRDTDYVDLTADEVQETEVKDFDFTDTDMSVFTDYESNDAVTEMSSFNADAYNYNESYDCEEYGYASITNEAMHEFWATNGEAVNTEMAKEYNEILKSHKNEEKWNKSRNGMGIVEASWMLSWGNDTMFKAGGYCSEFAMYEMECVEGLDYSKCLDILKFKKLAGGAFDISDDVLETLKHNEYTMTRYREDVMGTGGFKGCDIKHQMQEWDDMSYVDMMMSLASK